MSADRNDLKIYVVCHKEAFIPKCRYMVPIQVGCDMAATEFEHYVHDNTGDNISYKNPDYCELTALYWMWKNDKSSYVGLFHYRRYLALESGLLKAYLGHWKQFYYLGSLTQKSFSRLGFADEDNIRDIQKYDVVLPKCSELRYRNIENFYNLYERDHLNAELDHVLETVIDKYPEYTDAIKECRNSPKGYHYNMFIMKRETLEGYCEWLFPILDSMYGDIKSGAFVTDKERLIGYMAEFLMGVFICKNRNQLRIKEEPAVFFDFTDGKNHFVRTHIDAAIRWAYRLFFPAGSARERCLFRVTDGARYR